jgi:hypothetical protein
MICSGLIFGAFIQFANLTCTTDVPPFVCPPVRMWTKQFQKQIAAEIRAAPNSALAQVAVQSIGDRDVARACAKSKTAE